MTTADRAAAARPLQPAHDARRRARRHAAPARGRRRARLRDPRRARARARRAAQRRRAADRARRARTTPARSIACASCSGCDDDIAPFLALAERDELLAGRVARARGLRAARKGTCVHALVAGLAGQLVTFDEARRIERAIVRSAGEAHAGLTLSPDRAGLARLSAAEIAASGLASRRASALVRISAQLDLERLLTVPPGGGGGATAARTPARPVVGRHVLPLRPRPLRPRPRRRPRPDPPLRRAARPPRRRRGHRRAPRPLRRMGRPGEPPSPALGGACTIGVRPRSCIDHEGLIECCVPARLGSDPNRAGRNGRGKREPRLHEQRPRSARRRPRRGAAGAAPALRAGGVRTRRARPRERRRGAVRARRARGARVGALQLPPALRRVPRRAPRARSSPCPTRAARSTLLEATPGAVEYARLHVGDAVDDREALRAAIMWPLAIQIAEREDGFECPDEAFDADLRAARPRRRGQPPPLRRARAARRRARQRAAGRSRPRRRARARGRRRHRRGLARGQPARAAGLRRRARPPLRARRHARARAGRAAAARWPTLVEDAVRALRLVSGAAIATGPVGFERIDGGPRPPGRAEPRPRRSTCEGAYYRFDLHLLVVARATALRIGALDPRDPRREALGAVRARARRSSRRCRPMPCATRSASRCARSARSRSRRCAPARWPAATPASASACATSSPATSPHDAALAAAARHVLLAVVLDEQDAEAMAASADQVLLGARPRPNLVPQGIAELPPLTRHC